MKPVRISHLKQMGRSPAHWKGAEDSETYAMERGGALHSVLLGGKPVTFYPGPVRRGKEYDAFAKAHAGEIILTAGDYHKVTMMATSVRANPHAMNVLLGRHEVEVDWSFLGRACQSHVDVIGPDGRWVTELKSTNDASLNRSQWQALRMGWYTQLAFYDEAIRRANLGAPEAHYIVMVEQAPPYVVAVRRVTPRALLEGTKAWRLWFERLLACEAADHWPGYCEEIEAMDWPVEEDLDLVFPDAADDQEAA